MFDKEKYTPRRNSPVIGDKDYEDFSWYHGNPNWTGEAVSELDKWRRNTFTLQQPQARWFDDIEEYEDFQRRRERGKQETIWGWLNRELINPWIDRKKYWEY